MAILYKNPNDETIHFSSAVTGSMQPNENDKLSSLQNELCLRINEIDQLKSEIAALKVDVKMSVYVITV